jgi:hypothetical protein
VQGYLKKQCSFWSYNILTQKGDSQKILSSGRIEKWTPWTSIGSVQGGTGYVEGTVASDCRRPGLWKTVHQIVLGDVADINFLPTPTGTETVLSNFPFRVKCFALKPDHHWLYLQRPYFESLANLRLLLFKQFQYVFVTKDQ